jgi:hypothetical protein
MLKAGDVNDCVGQTSDEKNEGTTDRHCGDLAPQLGDDDCSGEWRKGLHGIQVRAIYAFNPIWSLGGRGRDVLLWSQESAVFYIPNSHGNK